MTENKVVTVSNRDRTLEEPITSLINSSFAVNWERNNTYKVSFTAYNDKSVSYALLVSENTINWNGQEFVIKQCVPSYAGNYDTVSVTAVHTYSDVRRIFQHKKKAGVQTYSVKDVLAFYLDKNPFGYTYDVSGDFPKQQITDLGGNNAFEGLSLIVSTWSDVIIYPQNKKIVVYTKDAFSTNIGNRLGYGHNADNMTLTYDSTGLINQLNVVSSNNKDNKPYFQTHTVRDEESIKEYGVWDGGDFTDERYHDSNSADKGARAKFITQPSVSVSVDYLGNEKPIPGEVRRLEIIDAGFSTNVMVVSYTYYPLDDGLKTNITLNSNAKTVLDFQRKNRNQLDQSKQNTSALSEAIQEANNQIEKIVLTQPKSWVIGNIEG